MSDAEFTVIDIFRIPSLRFPILAGATRGNFKVGDQVTLTRVGSGDLTGTVVAMDFHRKQPAPDNEFSITVDGPIGQVIKKGDVLHIDNVT